MSDQTPHLMDGRVIVAVPGEPIQLGFGVDPRYAELCGGAIWYRAGIVTVTAFETNTDVVVVGGRWVSAAVATRQGIPMYAGEQREFRNFCTDAIWMDVVVANEGVYFGYDPLPPMGPPSNPFAMSSVAGGVSGGCGR